jgi:predicted ester cyclase
VPEENKAVVRRFNELVEEYWRTGDADAFDEVVASDFVHHAPGLPPDLEGMKQSLPMFRAAFPDMRLTEEDLIAKGDKVADRVTVRGTHEGELMGIPATGKQVEFTETHISRIADGKIVERWGEWDVLGMMRPLGAVPQQAEG